jgi:hypothetical protein
MTTIYVCEIVLEIPENLLALPQPLTLQYDPLVLSSKTPTNIILDIASAVQHLEECEQERKVALHAELNRQIKLVRLDEQHAARYDKLKSWIGEKKAYLEKKEIIDSISGAQLQLRLLDAYDKESASLFETSVQSILKELGKELVREQYEKSSSVTEREQVCSYKYFDLILLIRQWTVTSKTLASCPRQRDLY